MPLAYTAAKLAQRCTYPACTRPPLEDNNQCQTHRDYHRARNRRWKRARQWAREQLGWVL
jgi:hypothetical protein